MQFRSDMTVHLVNEMASDHMVASAARVSTIGRESLVNDSRTNSGLINFLMRDRHGSPFEHNAFTFLIEAPIFVAREFMRHRAGWSFNEESGRYRELQPVFYVPDEDRQLVQVGKPGAYEFQAGTAAQYEGLISSLMDHYESAYQVYSMALYQGIAREVARVALPVGIYTSFYATCNARSLMHFLSLRSRHEMAAVPSFPQREIEMVAEQMEANFVAHMPITAAAFNAHGRVAPLATGTSRSKGSTTAGLNSGARPARS